MRILAIEPYFDGSHRAFLEQWSTNSCHEFSILELPGYKWKWRMRHASVSMAQRIRVLLAEGRQWDLVWCSDMLNLPELLGMIPELGRLPTVIYFHENQLTYPNRQPRERDYHFAYTNLVSAWRADAVWFNSRFHRNDFLAAMQAFLERMPDFRHLEVVDQIRSKSEVQPPGITPLGGPPKRSPEAPFNILWSARWEHDKNPEDFFAAIRQLEWQKLNIRLSVIGPSYRQVPPVFDEALAELEPIIDHWGFQSTRQQYEQVLRMADAVVSTARHEFFGLSVLEAVSAGAFPLVPRRLAYPEVLGARHPSIAAKHFYDGSPTDLALRLSELIERHASGESWGTTRRLLQAEVRKYDWKQRVPELDNQVKSIRNLTV